VKTLNNLRILITRPIHQTEKLANEIQFYGGLAICFPTIEIVGLKRSQLRQKLQKLADFDFVVFISPNAVYNAVEHIRALWPLWPVKTKTLAIGPGTREALTHHDLPADYSPIKNFSSQGLVEILLLKDPVQKKILVIKGIGGHLAFLQELKKRAATVSSLAVYKRELPRIVKSIPNANAIDIIICTSNTGLKNLVTLLSPTWRYTLFSKQLLVISARISEYAKTLGFVKTALIADNAGNEAILKTLLTWQAKLIESKPED
jgi:uroporphyrinogen-III synthase